MGFEVTADMEEEKTQEDQLIQEEYDHKKDSDTLYAERGPQMLDQEEGHHCSEDGHPFSSSGSSPPLVK